MRDISHTELVKLLDYNPETGAFTWKRRKQDMFQNRRSFLIWNTRYGGNIAGCQIDRGYIVIGVLGFRHYAHRLAWFYIYKEWPEYQIDHINHNRADNSIANLRSVTVAENNKNQGLSRLSKTGIPGINWDGRNSKWRVRVKQNGKEMYGGMFKDFDDAVLRREQINAKLGFHQNHGMPTR